MRKFRQELETAGLDWTDFDKGHTFARNGRRANTPAWTQSDARVRAVVTARICKSALEPNRPTDLAGLRSVEQKYVALLLNQKNAAVNKHVAVIQQFGGPAAFMTALLYRRFRLGEDSIELAEQFGITRLAVRANLSRMCNIARVLFPDPALHAPWKGKDTTPKWGAKSGRCAANLLGQRFGKLVVVESAPGRYGYSAAWLCQCDCGKQKKVFAVQLRRGDTKSCGCLAREVHRQSMRAYHAAKALTRTGELEAQPC